MTTVASRTFNCTPQRDASATWTAIVDLLTHSKSGPKRDELLSVAGIVASILTDHAPKDSAITVTCDGPRTRIYCLYDEDAIFGDGANEDTLGYDPLNGDWLISLPCLADDLAWVQGALKKYSERITARDLADVVPAEKTETPAAMQGLVLDVKGFLNP